MSNHAARLALGTVQFGLPYGVANSKGQVSLTEVREILQAAKSFGITTLDTAYAYGQSEEVLGQCEELKDFAVVTKLPPGTRTSKAAQEAVTTSLSRLGLKSVDAILLHAFEDYRQALGLIETLVNMKSQGQCRNIGFSLYYPEDLKLLLDRKVPCDLVQLPYSIVDRRFEPYFKILEERKIEVHIRSVFLQGGVFINPSNLPDYLKGAQAQIQKLHTIAQEQKLDISSLCLNFVLSCAQYAKVIIGIDSLQHLNDNIADLKDYEKVNQLHPALAGVAIQDENILLPFLWKK